MAKDFFPLIQDDLVEVEDDSWILNEDASALRSAVLNSKTEILMLPPRDPFLALPDRETLAPKKFHAAIWRIIANPGVLMVDGEVKAVWRMLKKSEKLQYIFECFSKISKSEKELVIKEAQRLAAFRECSKIEVNWE